MTPGPTASTVHPTRVMAMSGTRQRAVLLAALLAVVVEVLGLLDGLPAVDVGRIVVSPSVAPATIIAVLLGHRALGRARTFDAALPFWVAIVVGASFAASMFVRGGYASDVPALILAAANEELVYRFAVPVVAAAVLVTFKVPHRPARVAGFALAAVWFVLLPGHRAQISDVAEVLPFLAFATLAALVVYRSGSIAAAAAAHLMLNMFTILALGGDIGRVARGIGLGCLLMLLVAAYGGTRPRSERTATPGAGPPDDELVIDLRDPVSSGPARAPVVDLRDAPADRDPVAPDRHR